MESVFRTLRFCCGLGFILASLINPSFSQSQERQVIAAAGNTLTEGGYSLDFTIGETMTNTLVNNGTISQGFHQVWAVITAVEETVEELHASLFPNPTPDVLHVESPESAELRLSDMNGRPMLHRTVSEGINDIEVDGLAAGTYIIQMQGANSGKLKVFKMVKVD